MSLDTLTIQEVLDAGAEVNIAFRDCTSRVQAKELLKHMNCGKVIADNMGSDIKWFYIDTKIPPLSIVAFMPNNKIV